MSWHGIEGHDAVVELFRRALERQRLASSFLFAGPSGIGKRTFALKLAQAMLCQSGPEAALDPCETCPSCTMVLAGTHPDLDLVGKPADKAFLPLELLIGQREHRRQEGLCHNISLKPFMGGRKIAVIDDADFLNAEGANCLLKTLEEPPPQSVLILIGTSPAKQLPTIRSRCQLVRFQPLSAEVVAEVLLSKGLVADAAEARRLAQHAEGSVQRALELADPALWAFRARSTSAWRPRCWRACAWRPASRPSSRRPARRPRPGGRGCGRSSALPPVFMRGCSRCKAAPHRRTTPTCGAFSTRRPLVPPAASRRRPRAWTAAWTPWKRSTATPIKRR